MRAWLALPLLAVAAFAAAASGVWVKVPGGTFRSALKYEDGNGTIRVPSFEMMSTPVTNAQFLAFVRAHPEWRRDRVPRAFAEARFLQHGAAPDALGAKAGPQQPVVNVSWFAADAYCAAQNARLPTWSEWEYAAAADRTRRDARGGPAWREAILGWYAKPSTAPLADVGQAPANLYGIHDLHGLEWEWVQDYASMLVTADSRNQGDPDRLKFCGAGALSMDDRENYAVLMRVAMLSSLEAVNTTVNLGFRCARDAAGAKP